MSACVQTSVPCALLPWDSEFFGYRIGRVGGDTLDEEQAEALDQWSHSEGVRCLYFLARADCPATIETAERHGFSLVDLRVTLECRMSSRSVGARSPSAPRAHPRIAAEKPDCVGQAALPGIRPAQPSDVIALQSLARSVHRDTRFFSDRHFSRTRAEELYATWIQRDCERHDADGARTFVAASGAAEPVGYTSCDFDCASRTGQIGLVGVGPQARNKGLGKALVRTALDWLVTQGAEAVTVVTQGKNLGAQRLYQQCGFVTRDLQLWYHKWYATYSAA